MADDGEVEERITIGIKPMTLAQRVHAAKVAKEAKKAGPGPGAATGKRTEAASHPSLPSQKHPDGRLGYVISYYKQFAGLTEHLHKLRKLPEDVRVRLEIVIVDDGSPERPLIPNRIHWMNLYFAFFARKIGCYRLRVVRIANDIGFNSGGAKNTAVTFIDATRIFFTDLDFCPDPAVATDWFHHSMNADGKQVMRVRGPSNKVHGNAFAIHKDVIRRVGLYDETYSGTYGHEDGNLSDRLAAAKVKFTCQADGTPPMGYNVRDANYSDVLGPKPEKLETAKPNETRRKLDRARKRHDFDAPPPVLPARVLYSVTFDSALHKVLTGPESERVGANLVPDPSFLPPPPPPAGKE
jgi:hypothetical protein